MGTINSVLWRTSAVSLDVPGLHTNCAKRVKSAFDWFSKDAGVCGVRVSEIASRARVSKRTAQLWLSAFVRWGWITVDRRGCRSALRVFTSAAPHGRGDIAR